MADPREFVLIGRFDDRITPSLEKINNSVSKLKANLADLSNVTKPLKKDFRELATLSKDFNSSLKGQAGDIRNMTAALKAYRNEMGRVNRAYRAGGSQLMRQVAPPPSAPPRSPAVGRGGRGASLAAGAGGAVAGFQLGEMITGSIVRGFQIGVGIMQKPFQYAANAFGERIRDELSDIQSAGGLFATDRRYGLNLFKDFGEARRTQEMINARLAKSAAELPGETAQYVREAKRITDTMIGAMGRSQEAFVKFAEGMGAKRGDKEDALATVIQKFTEKAVLLGQQPGGGGTRSIYGVPQLLEMMVNMPQLNLRAMSYRYASLRDNPLLANALQQGEAKINATAVGTADRLKAIMEVLDQALPNEVVSAMRNSMDGIIQTIKSAIIDPETGIFGLGRKMTGVLVPRVDSLGRYLDKAGNVVEDISKAEMETASLYSLLRESIAGFIVPLQGLINILPQIYDPLKAIGLDMVEFRNTAQRFLAVFNGFTKTFEGMGGEIKKTASARGGLLTIANLLQNLGKIDTAGFQKYSKMLQDPNANLGAIAKSLFTELFDSKFMEMLGKVIGNIVGGALKMVGDLMSGVTDMANAGPFAKGLKKGWDEAQGSSGVAKIFKSLFSLIGNLLLTAFKAAPFEMSLLTALTVGMPLISGLVTAGMTALFESVFTANLFNFIKTKIMNMIAAMIVQGSVMTTSPAAAGAALSGGAGATAAGGFAASLTRLLPLLSRLTVTLTAITIVGGGIEGTIRQLSQFLGELGNSIKGAFGGLFDTLGVLGGFVGDLGRRIGELIGPLFGAKDGFDGLKIVLAPITLAFQALSIGLKGLALAFAELRVFLARITGDKEYQKRIKERDELAASYGAERGRINAYNASMQGPAAVKKQINDAVFELQSNPKLTAARSAELKAFIAEARGQTAGVKPAPGKPTTASGGGTPVNIAANSPASKALTTTSTQTTQINAKASQQIQKISQTNSLLAMMSAQLSALNNTMATNAFKMQSFGMLGFNPYGGGAGTMGARPPVVTKNGTRVSPIFNMANGGIGSAIMNELAAMPSGSRLVVANSSETIMPKGYSMAMSQGGGPVTVNAPVTIHQQPGQDSEELASIVAMKIGEAVAQARSSSVFV